MEAYSLDLRERICAACDDGADTHQEVAERFGVGRWFVQKLLRQRRRSGGGSIAPRPRGRGPAPSIGTRDRQRLIRLVRQRPDATLAELCRSLVEAGGAGVNVWTMCRALKSLRLVRKKRRCTRASGTRRGCVRCAGTSSDASRRWRPSGWSSWTRAGSTPP